MIFLQIFKPNEHFSRIFILLTESIFFPDVNLLAAGFVLLNGKFLIFFLLTLCWFCVPD